MAGSANQQDLNNQRELNSGVSEQLSLEDALIKLLSERVGISRNFLSDQQDVNNVLIDQTTQLKFQVSEKKIIRDIGNDITKASYKAYSQDRAALGLTKTNVDLAKTQESLTSNILILEQQRGKFLKQGTREAAEMAESIQMQVDNALQLKEALKSIQKESQAISGAFGVKAFAGLAEVVKSVPGISKFAGAFEEAAEAARAQGAESVKVNAATNRKIDLYKKLRKEGVGWAKALGQANLSDKELKKGKLPLKATGTLAAGFKSLGPSLAATLGPLALLGKGLVAIGKSWTLLDKQSGVVAKSMGTSAAEGRKLVASSAAYAKSSGDGLLSAKDLVDAQITLNKEFGTSIRFSDEFAANFSHVAERTGLSSEAMGRFASLALQAGTNVTDQLAKVNAVSMEMKAQTGILLNGKDIQEGIGKLSSAQILNAGQHSDQLAYQVVQSRLLGLSSSQLEKSASSMLDFESSIQAEMEAELLTGRSLNLEAARHAALLGKQGDFAKEVAKEVGTAEEFGKLNVIQANALAKAFGLSREEMSEMLIKQEQLKKIQGGNFKDLKDAQNQYNAALEKGNLTAQLKADLEKAGLLAQFESATIEEKRQAGADKLLDIFISMIDPVMAIVSPIVDLLVPALAGLEFLLTPVVDIFNGISGILTGDLETLNGWEMVMGTIAISAGVILGLVKSVAFYNGMIKAYKISQIALDATEKRGIISKIGSLTVALGIQLGIMSASMATNAAVTFGVGVAVAVAAAALGYAAVKAMTADDMISPPGYGGRTLMGPEGTIALNDKDTVIAGTNLFPEGGGGNSGGSQNNSEVVALLKELISAVNQEGDVYLDGQKVGYALALQSSRMG